MRFDPDDLDWLIGELHHAIEEGKSVGQLLHDFDSSLAKEALGFFAERHSEFRTSPVIPKADLPFIQPPTKSGPIRLRFGRLVIWKH